MGIRETLGLRPPVPADRQLRDALDGANSTIQEMAQSMAQLELAVDDEGWRRLTHRLETDFTRSGLDDLMDVSRAMYLSHPLVQRAVNVTVYYTWAQGVEYNAEEERIQEEVVDQLVDNIGNRRTMFGHQAQLLTDVDQMVDGNIFVPLFTTDMGDVSVRSIPADEIRDIHYKPGDRAVVMYYRREWSDHEFDVETGNWQVQQRTALYPDIHYMPVNQPDSIGGVDVRWDAPIMHQRTGGLRSMKFGVPETYAALDWARAYKRFLEDWHTIVASLARFAWKATTSGTKVAGTRDKLASTVTDTGAAETNRLEAGSVAVMPAGDDLTPMPKSGATTSADDAKPSRLMVGAAMNLPDTILSGDPDQGNLATAKTLDRPTELGMVARQAMWREQRQELFRYVVDARVFRGKLPGRRIRTPDGWEVEPSIDPTVQVNFPPVLEHDPKDTVAALVSAATLDGKTTAGTIPHEVLARELMSAVGVEDIEGALENLDPEGQAALDQAVDQLAKLMPQQPPAPAPAPPPQRPA